VTHFIRALPDIFRVSAAEIVAYRAELIIWVLTATLPLIQLALWNSVAADGPIGGFDQAGIARYFAATLLVRQLTSSWLVWMLNWDIRTGVLSQRLLKPFHPLWQYGVRMLLAMPIRVAVLVPVLVPIVWIWPQLVRMPAPWELALFVVSVALAWTITFLVQALIGTASFWVDKSESLFTLWFAVWMVCSGYAAPMSVLPAWAAGPLRWMVFRATLATPVEIIGGFLDLHDALVDVGVQLAWTATLLALALAAWRRGVARFGAFGA
jgi:ABC-2 type transport system permease protein